MNLYVENPKDYTIKAIKNKQIQYSHRLQKSAYKNASYLYISNELSKKEIKKIIFHNNFKNNYILRNKLNQEYRRLIH